MKGAKRALLPLILGLVLSSAPPVTAQRREDDGFGVRVLRQDQGGYLGVNLRDVRGADVSNFKLPAEGGVVVQRVLPRSPAEEAGLQKDDVILQFNDDSVHSVAHLKRLVHETPPGRSVRLVVMREGQRRDLTVKLGEERRGLTPAFPEETFRIEPYFRFGQIPDFVRPFMGQPARLGVQVQDLSEQLAEYFKVPGKAGVLVASVNEGSAAQKAGLKAGDVIMAADGKAIGDTGDLLQVLRNEDLSTLKLDCIRNGQKVTITVTLEPLTKRPAGRGIRM